MTYPPAGNDPYGQQPPSYDPTATPPPPVSADPYAANPYAQPGYPQQQPAYGVPAYGNPYATYAQVQPSGKNNGMAIAAMVLGICGVLFACCYGFGGLPGLVGAILGHISMKQIRERGEAGRGMALAGVITGWSGVALAIAFWVLIIIVAVNDPNFFDNLNSRSSNLD